VRRTLDVRTIGGRRVLPHHREGTDDVRDQARRRVSRVEARARVHRNADELLRRMCDALSRGDGWLDDHASARHDDVALLTAATRPVAGIPRGFEITIAR
jgi:hypothetical protein